MCLLVLKHFKNAKVAKKDIIVWKRFNDPRDTPGNRKKLKILISAYQDFPYETDKLYQTEIGQVDLNKKVNGSIYRLYETTLEYHRGSIEEGFHSYTSLKQAKLQRLDWAKEIIVQCTIPKGSLYYKGVADEIVSNQIVIGREQVKIK